MEDSEGAEEMAGLHSIHPFPGCLEQIPGLWPVPPDI
jgi:hypothetical protein